MSWGWFREVETLISWLHAVDAPGAALGHFSFNLDLKTEKYRHQPFLKFRRSPPVMWTSTSTHETYVTTAA